MATDFDVELYLRLIELKRVTNSRPTLSLLQKMVKQHVTHVVYQNHDLFVDRAEVDMSSSSLLERLLVERKGGMCYESSELLRAALLHFKFDVRRVPAFCLINGEIFDTGAVDDHQILVVVLDDRFYLVDVAFAYNSVREPIEFTFNATEEKVLNAAEKYRLETFDDHHVLHMWLKDSFAPMYRFARPLRYMDDDQFSISYRRFLSTLGSIDQRSAILKIGVLTDTGRLGLKCDKKTRDKTTAYTMLYSQNYETPKSICIPFEKFKETVNSIVDLKLNEEYFRR